MRQPDLEALPQRESTAKRRLYGWDCKRCDLKFPMRRFLESHVGEVWNDVHKKIHHLKDKFSGGEYTVDQVIGWYVSFGEIKNHRFYDFYIDDNGILCKNERRKYVGEVDKTIYYVTIDKQAFGLRNDGMWYKIYFEWIPEPHYVWREEVFCGKAMWLKRNLSDKVYDVWFHRYLSQPADSPWHNNGYCSRYTQVNKKELRSIKKFLMEQRV